MALGSGCQTRNLKPGPGLGIEAVETQDLGFRLRGV